MIGSETQESVVMDEQKKSKKNVKKFVYIFSVIVVVVIVLAVGIGVYNSPVNKASRQLNLGYKYMENGEYEEAALAFEKAIAIDDKCIEAYAGGVEAYINIGDEETLQAFYEKAVTVVESLDGEYLEQNMDYVVEIYMMADGVYSNTTEQIVEILEKGWGVTFDSGIKNKLMEEYFILAKEKDKTKDYEEELKAYDELLELGIDEGRVLESLEKCLIEFLELLVAEGRYDEISVLIEKYENIVKGVDFDRFLEQSKETEALEEETVTENKEADVQEENEMEPEEDDTVSEEDGATSESTENVADAPQSDNWVDDLYQKIIEEDVDAVFEIMERPDFIEKCEAFPHELVAWSTDYMLSTSDKKIVWVVKGMDSNFLSVAYHPEYNYFDSTSENYYDISLWGTPEVYEGDFAFEIDFDGERAWLIKSTGYNSDGSAYEMRADGLWKRVFHM